MGGRAPLLLLWWAFSLSGRATLPGSSSWSKVEADRNSKFTIASWYQVASAATWCPISKSLLIHLGKGDGQIELGVRQE